MPLLLLLLLLLKKLLQPTLPQSPDLSSPLLQTQALAQAVVALVQNPLNLIEHNLSRRCWFD